MEAAKQQHQQLPETATKEAQESTFTPEQLEQLKAQVPFTETLNVNIH